MRVAMTVALILSGRCLCQFLIVRQLSHDRQATVARLSSNCRTIVKQLSHDGF